MEGDTPKEAAAAVDEDVDERMRGGWGGGDRDAVAAFRRASHRF